MKFSSQITLDRDLVVNNLFSVEKQMVAIQTPLVSIVLCTYNGEEFLRAQVETLLAQTYANLEIIISDDRSTDNTYLILENFAKRDPRIRLYQNEVNIGFNKNFEKALQYASGTWCAISDQDDIWEVNKIERMMQYAGDCALIHCDSNKFKSGLQPSKKQNNYYCKFEGNDVRKSFLYNTFEGHCLLVRKDIALKSMPFPEDVYYDWWIGMNATVNGGVKWINSVLAFRRIHERNASQANFPNGQRERNKLQQAIRNLNSFLTIQELKESEKAWGEELRIFLELCLKGNKKPLAEFLQKNRKLIFYYKRKRFISWLSHRKAIWKLIRQ